MVTTVTMLLIYTVFNWHGDRCDQHLQLTLQCKFTALTPLTTRSCCGWGSNVGKALFFLIWAQVP
jgi:hypothetical protein